MSKEKEDCPLKMVSEDVCKARMNALDTKMKYLFASSIITIVLIVVQLLKG
jgi:hypothetical protein